MKIEPHGVYNSGDSELGNVIIRPYNHIKIYSQYFIGIKLLSKK